jgi:hypothetical protein
MSVNSLAQDAAKYGITGFSLPSDPGSGFVLAKMGKTPEVNPYSATTRTTAGNRMAWRNLNQGAGGGTFQNFGDSGSSPMMPQSLGA